MLHWPPGIIIPSLIVIGDMGGAEMRTEILGQVIKG